MPSDLQNHILKSKAINESRNLWCEYFKVLVTHTIPNPDDSDSDNMDNILAQANWEDYFGSSTRVYESKHPFPGLLVNYNDETDEDERDPAWLSRMFESGFIRLIQLTSHDQITQTAPKSFLRRKSLFENHSFTVDSAITTSEVTGTSAPMMAHGVLIHQMILTLTKAIRIK